MKRAAIGVSLLAMVMGFGLIPGCGDDGESPDDTYARVLLSTEGERLNAYDLTHGWRKQAVVTGGEDEHAGGLSLNGQICFDPHGSRLFVAANDAGQPAIAPGWAVMRLHGDRVGELAVDAVGMLTPTYRDDRDTYGCAYLDDGRVLTTDIGNNASGPATGQLIVWFPPIDAPNPRYCKLDIAIGTAGGIYVDAQKRIYVGSARVNPAVYRYSDPLPTSDDASGGCGAHDPTGAPLADGFRRETFIAADSHVRTPSGVAGSPRGTFYVSSVFNGVIAEYDAGGKFLREIVRPAPGESLGPEPYSTGTPFGLTADADGTIYYADLAIIVTASGIGPGRHLGTVRRVEVDNGPAPAPVIVDGGLDFPDGVALLTLP